MITEFLGRQLDRFQLDAINALAQGTSVLVAAPTGTGKTLIADYLVHKIESEGKRVVFTAPIKALSNQKFRDYIALFGPYKVGLVTGDLVINQDAPIVIMTTEILRNVLLQAQSSHVSHHTHAPDPLGPPLSSLSARIDNFERIGAVIMDEIHFLGDPSRGTVWEETLIYLPKQIQLLGLSATLSNLDDFAEWLSKTRQQPIQVIKEDTRAVPLTYFLTNRTTGCVPPEQFQTQYRKWIKDVKRKQAKRSDVTQPSSKSYKRHHFRRHRDPFFNDPTNHLDALQSLDTSSFPLLYFIYSRKLTEKYAHALGKSHVSSSFAPFVNRSLLKRRIHDFQTNNPGVLRRHHMLTLEKGIAYHHAGVHVALKTFIEQLYEERLIAVLYCTSTFALGVNMPARSVVFDSMTRFDGTDIVPLEAREFMQMAGRAGRRGIDNFGHVIIRMPFDKWKESRDSLNNILQGTETPVTSSFNLSFNSVLHLITRYTEPQIKEILNASFRAYELNKEAEQAAKNKLYKPNSSHHPHQKPDPIPSPDSCKIHYQRPVLWEQFHRKLLFLRNFNYISEDNELFAAGKICIRIQFAEILMTELYISGVFEDLPLTMIFGMLTGLVQTLPRSAAVERPSDPLWWDVFQRLEDIYNSDAVQVAQELVQEPTTLCLEIMPLGQKWAEGDSLSTIMQHVRNPTDLSGDLVGSFRRAKDLFGQMRTIIYEDVDLRNQYSELLIEVSRDEVEAVG